MKIVGVGAAMMVVIMMLIIDEDDDCGGVAGDNENDSVSGVPTPSTLVITFPASSIRSETRSDMLQCARRA
jgi:hypothetical protein